MYTLEDVYKTFLSGCTEDYKILRAFEMGKQASEKRIAELEKENTELKSENQKWKDEWQEQVQKATDEGYARTLQTIQLTKAKELLERFLGLGNLWDLDCKDYFPLRKEAEQFLNSEVEK